MKDDEKWPLVHEYRRMVALELVPPIKCPECGGEMVPTIYTDGSPALKCFSDDAVWHIGLSVYERMQKNLREIFDGS